MQLYSYGYFMLLEADKFTRALTSQINLGTGPGVAGYATASEDDNSSESSKYIVIVLTLCMCSIQIFGLRCVMHLL